MNELFSRGIKELKNKLIDTSRRNKLINYRRPSKARNLKIIDESAEFIFQHLIDNEGKFEFKFIPEPEINNKELEKLQKQKKVLEETLKSEKVLEETNSLFKSENINQLNIDIVNISVDIKNIQQQALLTPEERAKELGFDISNVLPDINLDGINVEDKHIDDSLQTLHYPHEMEKILTNIERNAKSIINETGSNMLYLILGVLEWSEANNSEKKNKSPLINIPVTLTKIKKSKRYEFTLTYTGEGLDTNRSLAEKLAQDFNIVLPELREDISFNEYLQDVSETISSKKNWNLKQEISLDFLHFGKILMYQDLKEENWNNGNGLSENPIFQDIFIGKEVASDTTFAPEYNIDNHETACSIPLVMDADSSQHSAIVDVLAGKNVIIEGPPGTGKSQTISNIIASLLANGKSVLFVSEKLAALEVVYRRLDSIGIGDFCLELHSHKSQKLKILQSIKQRMGKRYPNIEVLDRTIEEIEHQKKELQKYIDTIHEKFGKIDKKIYDIFWLTEKYQKAAEYLKFDIPDANEYTHYKISTTIEELKKYKAFYDAYDFESFYWKGLDLYKLNFVDIDNFTSILELFKTHYSALNNEFRGIPLDIEDEYEAVINISTFIASHMIEDTNIDILILNQLSIDTNSFVKYLEQYENLNNLIGSIYSNLNEFNPYIEFNIKLIDTLIKLDTITKGISRELGISKNTNIYFLHSLLNGIKQVINIGKESYVDLTNEYGTTSFTNALTQAKNEYANYLQIRKTLSLKTNISKVDVKSVEEILNIKKIIVEKKDSFFNFFSGEYKTSKNELEDLMIDSLPKDKNLWINILDVMIDYIHCKTDLENNSANKTLFNNLFKGVDTNWDDIEELHNWATTLRQEVNINDLITLLINGDESNYNVFNSYKEELNNTLNEFDELIHGISNVYDSKTIKKFYYDIEDIDIIEFRDKLETLNEDIENLNTNYYRISQINKNEDFETEFIKSVNNVDLEEVFSSIKRYDPSLNDILFNYEKLITVKVALSKIQKNILDKYQINIDISKRQNLVIKNTVSLFETIDNSSLNTAIKSLLLSDYNYKDVLTKIHTSYKKLMLDNEKIKEYGNINKSFYGDGSIKLTQCIEKLETLNENKNTLSIWSDFRKISHSIIDLGLEEIVNKIENKEMPLDMIVPSFYYNFYNTLIKNIFNSNPLLNGFSRLSHEQVIKNFKELDSQLIIQNRNRVAYLASQRDIPQGYRSNRVSDLTELALIEHEVNKKKRHIPIRQLVRRAPGALKALKPCFMMSPLSVSQYLPPNDIKFDVLVVDEASQLRPEESLGCIARVSQVVIVGDPKQLPPTSFFESLDKNKDEEETVASESESILDICLNLYKPIRRLRWHYRSQHESLIDFSNHQFYDGNLIVFPSPSSIKNDELGVKYHYIENSIFHKRRNKVEAKIIIEHLEKQMKNYPDRSIGIGTFNSDQRDLIQDLVDERERLSPIISNFISTWNDTSEPFFIKNLENLQGDERDVIIISTTYGKDKDTRKVYQRFGPINTDTGWRRLNVMFTRAKQKMEIFTSLLSSDIIVGEHSSRGVRAFKAFLNFVETGRVTHSLDITNKGFDSDFEESVYNILNDAGYKSVPQVGVAGYFIDLSVVSEKNEHDFVLAIECDGATYHSSKSARDRDRLKQEVLEKLGWTVYRIWSVDWYKNREHEISKLIAVVAEAQATYKGSVESEPVQQKIIVEEIEEINEDIDAEVQKEIEGHIHTESTIVKSKYTQMFLSDDKVKEMLIELRDTKIASEFTIDRRSILSDMMIEQFVEHKPIDMDEFRSFIPKRYRNTNMIDIEQMKYLNDIFDILELADE